MNIDYEELKERGFYEYVSRHYWEMSKEQLAQFVKELSFSAENRMGDYEYERAEEDAIEELKSMDV